MRAARPSPPPRASSPARAASSVDFPAPFGPSTASDLAGAQRRDRRRAATSRPPRRAAEPARLEQRRAHDGRPSTVRGRRCCSTVSSAAEQQHEAEQDDAERDRPRVLPGAHAHEHRAGERLRLPVDVAADEHDRADLGERGADRRDRGREDADPRLAQREQGHRAARRAERARLVEQPGGQRLHRRGGERDDDRERRAPPGRGSRPRACRAGPSPPSGAPRKSRSATTRPTITGGSPMPAFARASPAPRPRNRPSPSARPSGRPSASAISVDQNASRSVTPTMPSTSSSPLSSRSTAWRSPSQRNSTSGLLRCRRAGRRPGGRPCRRARPPRPRARPAGARAGAAVSPRLVITVWPSGPERTTVTSPRVSTSSRSSDASAASRKATASTTPRSNRLTSPSSGSPARSSRRRARGWTGLTSRPPAAWRPRTRGRRGPDRRGGRARARWRSRSARRAGRAR